MESVFRILVWFLLFAGWSAPVVPVESGTAQQAPMEARLDEPFALSFGASATLVDGPTVTFEQLVQDSRCPEDVLCEWAGIAVVALGIEAAGEEAQVAELGGYTDQEGVLRSQRHDQQTAPSAVVSGYTVELLAVTPYPATVEAMPAETDYQVQVVVRAGEGAQ